MKFTKMHGLGNDFILIDLPELPQLEAWEETAIQMCDRHFGIGADGLVLLFPVDDADFGMRILNRDGSVTEQCGNAIRCAGRYYYEKNSSAKQTLVIQTRIGNQTVSLTEDEVCVNMGEPILQGLEIPVDLDLERVVKQSIDVNGERFWFTAVSMGNPHIVIEVEDAATFPIEIWGPLLETHALFPNRANIEFITVRSATDIQMRVWERGVGQTLACGSGACAVLVASVLNGQTETKAQIELLGGELTIEWNQENQQVYMTGPATFVFEGEWVSS
ncbi:diaminopimelate epimerase [Hazenella sp. IB182353]|uniref:diaminopimelate epimerase n=1 Tax=Polycladospora coralii TaxID=2771432 RepID=UPI0017468573|nr:diaminopimelate epimerase [Polycladospora coralii]MBS7530326.1 diaminopimelate epimerase [Polycladospora coralii]